uniref:Uncharacterized protein n=1 Tax=Echeneis naucrates TaxID=173247 RepID=A0A665UMB7_ECHNA
MAPASAELTGWRKYFNSYTLQGRLAQGCVSLILPTVFQHPCSGNVGRCFIQ